MDIIPIFGKADVTNYGIIVEFRVPSGKCAELFSVGIIPDYDPNTGASNLDYVYIAHSKQEGQIGSAFPFSRFSATWGMNSLPFGTGQDKVQRYQFDVPGMPDNLTYKFVAGDVIQVVGVTKAGATAPNVRAIMLIALLDKSEVEAIYGVSADDFNTLSGGYAGKHIRTLYADFIDFTTQGSGQWEDVKTISVEPFESIQIREIGVSADENAELLRFYDENANKYFPTLDSATLVINQNNNMLQFGDPVNDYQPRASAPEDLAMHVFSGTNIHVYVKDNGNASSGRIQLVGVYEKGK